MKVAVWNEGKWMPSKFSDGDNLRVTFKGLDDNVSYYLNLDTTHKGYEKWIPFIEKGNVLDVFILQGTNTINKFGEFKIIKEIKEPKMSLNNAVDLLPPGVEIRKNMNDWRIQLRDIKTSFEIVKVNGEDLETAVSSMLNKLRELNVIK